MTIEDPDAFNRNVWDWSILNGCFGDTPIAPTDIDGAVERKGQFLFFETKEPGVPLKEGQTIFYSELAKKPGVTVLVIWGQKDKPELMQLRTHAGLTKPQICDLALLRRWVSRWFYLADRRQSIVIRPEDLDGAA